MRGSWLIGVATVVFLTIALLAGSVLVLCALVLRDELDVDSLVFHCRERFSSSLEVPCGEAKFLGPGLIGLHIFFRSSDTGLLGFSGRLESAEDFPSFKANILKRFGTRGFSLLPHGVLDFCSGLPPEDRAIHCVEVSEGSFGVLVDDRCLGRAVAFLCVPARNAVLVVSGDTAVPLHREIFRAAVFQVQEVAFLGDSQTPIWEKPECRCAE